MNEISKRQRSRLSSLAIKAAREAGKLIARRSKKTGPVGFKSARNPVTETDLLAEKKIVGIIKREYPGHRVIAEETGETGGDSDFSWWIDPLDGTTNFSRGYPHFAVSIGLEHKDRIILGVVFDPLRDELFRAIEGEGAFLNRNRIQTSPVRKLSRALMATGFPYDPASHPRALGIFSRIVTQTQGVRRDGSAALNLCYVAAGRFDGFWEIGLKPWDTAAGIIILREAGGKVTGVDGKKFDIRKGDVLASNRLIHGQLLRIVEESSNKQRRSRCRRGR